MSDDRKRPSHQLHLLYHELRAGESAYSYVTSAALFEQHLDVYAQVMQGAGTVFPEVTFDDGHVSNLLVAAPLLERYGMKARFFITAGWTGQNAAYMDWAQLRELHAAGHEIGAHGWSHKLLTHCDASELGVELRDARRVLEDRLGVSVTTMSLPGGRSNRRVLEACGQAGYTRVYTSVPKAEPMPLGATVGRLNIRGDMQPEWIARLFAGDGDLLAKIEKRHRRKEMVKRLLGDRMYAKLWALANRKEAATDGGEDATG